MLSLSLFDNKNIVNEAFQSFGYFVLHDDTCEKSKLQISNAAQ